MVLCSLAPHFQLLIASGGILEARGFGILQSRRGILLSRFKASPRLKGMVNLLKYFRCLLVQSVSFNRGDSLFFVSFLLQGPSHALLCLQVISGALKAPLCIRIQLPVEQLAATGPPFLRSVHSFEHPLDIFVQALHLHQIKVLPVLEHDLAAIGIIVTDNEALACACDQHIEEL